VRQGEKVKAAEKQRNKVMEAETPDAVRRHRRRP
jgi:hypothetical protein